MCGIEKKLSRQICPEVVDDPILLENICGPSIRPASVEADLEYGQLTNGRYKSTQLAVDRELGAPSSL